MNIFDALSRGKGSINEENITSFITYLMKPDESHGLKKCFLIRFLEEINLSDILEDEDYYYEIEPEKQYNKRIIDIQITVYNKKENRKTPFKIIAIENKINIKSIQSQQFQEEYKTIKETYPNSPITMVFLAPENKGKNKYMQEFNTLADLDKGDQKKYLYWEKIITILKDILTKEQNIDIEPLTDYLKHTIKAFIFFINTKVLFQQIKSPEIYYSLDAIYRVNVMYEKNKNPNKKDVYQLLFFKDHAIRIKDLNGNKEEGYIVKDMLRDIYNTLDIKYSKNKGDDTTRQMGSKILTKINRDNIKEIKINYEDYNDIKFDKTYTNEGSNLIIINDDNN